MVLDLYEIICIKTFEMYCKIEEAFDIRIKKCVCVEESPRGHSSHCSFLLTWL